MKKEKLADKLYIVLRLLSIVSVVLLFIPSLNPARISEDGIGIYMCDFLWGIEFQFCKSSEQGLGRNAYTAMYLYRMLMYFDRFCGWGSRFLYVTWQ